MLNIFVSYSHADSPTIDMFVNGLTGLGHKVFLDRYDIKPGDHILQKAKSLIDQSDLVLVFLTKQSVHSEWVAAEVDYSLKASKKIIPLVEDSAALNPNHPIRQIRYINVYPYELNRTYAELSSRISELDNEKIMAGVVILGVALLAAYALSRG